MEQVKVSRSSWTPFCAISPLSNNDCLTFTSSEQKLVWAVIWTACVPAVNVACQLLHVSTCWFHPSSKCRSEGEGTRKCMNRVELAVFESRKKREGLSSADSLQEEEQQLCDSELCLLIYNKASVKTWSTFENMTVFSCKILFSCFIIICTIKLTQLCENVWILLWNLKRPAALCDATTFTMKWSCYNVLDGDTQDDGALYHISSCHCVLFYYL